MYLPILALAALAYWAHSSKKNDKPKSPQSPAMPPAPPGVAAPPLELKPTNYGPGLTRPYHQLAQIVEMGKAFTPQEVLDLKAEMDFDNAKIRPAFATADGTYFDLALDAGGNKASLASLTKQAGLSNLVTVGDDKLVTQKLSTKEQPAQVLVSSSGRGVVIRRKPKPTEPLQLGLLLPGQWLLLAEYGDSA